MAYLKLNDMYSYKSIIIKVNTLTCNDGENMKLWGKINIRVSTTARYMFVFFVNFNVKTHKRLSSEYRHGQLFFFY